MARHDGASVDRHLDLAEVLQIEYKTAQREHAIRTMGGEHATDHGGLGAALLAAGYDRKTHPNVTVDQSFALGVQMKAGSVLGGIDGTEVADVFVAPPLGIDDRYLYPRLRTQFLTSDDTGVRSYRQASRTLASPSTMIRDIGATSAKPGSGTAAEVVTEPLHQIATVSTHTPNVLLESMSFRSWVNADLAAAYRTALDYHIVTEITAAPIPSGGGGANAFEDVLYSQEVVRAAGYSPDLAVVSPADGLAIELLTMTGGSSYAFAQRVPSLVVSPAVEDGAGFVADTSAIGILFLSQFSVRSFEEEAWQTNSSVRAESNGLFLVQRPDAAAMLSGS